MDEARAKTEGEIWTRAQLQALLARKFSPPGVARFLIESTKRSARIRRERPELARRAYAWIALGCVAYALRSPRYAIRWWAATALMLDWHLGMFETEDGEPRNMSAADALTLVRAWMVPPALERPTPLLVGLAALTDTLDGPIARATSPTRAGRDLEGLVDACFAAAALRGAIVNDQLSGRVGAAELGRLAAGFSFALAVYFGRAEAPPDDLLHAARTTTTLRVGGLVLGTAGHRRSGDALLLAGSGLSVAMLVRALVTQRRQ